MSVAPRLAAAPGASLVSEATKERCETDFLFSEPREIEAKGTTETVRAYEVRGESSARLRDAGPYLGGDVVEREVGPDVPAPTASHIASG